MRYIVLGPEGTFTDLAYQKLKTNDFAVIYVDTIEQVFKHMTADDYGILPIENTLEGYIQPTLDGILKHRLHIIDQIELPIAFTLIGNVRSKQDIVQLYVQFATKGQCSNLIESLDHATINITENNVMGYERIKLNMRGEAALVPTHMLQKNDSVILMDAADSRDNKTRFVLISHQSEHIKSDHYRISLSVTPIKDRPGLLYDILGVFKQANINLISIMSRPTKTKMGNYHFFIDLLANDAHLDKIINVIQSIEGNFKVIIYGIYPHISS